MTLTKTPSSTILTRCLYSSQPFYVIAILSPSPIPAFILTFTQIGVSVTGQIMRWSSLQITVMVPQDLSCNKEQLQEFAFYILTILIPHTMLCINCFSELGFHLSFSCLRLLTLQGKECISYHSYKKMCIFTALYK